ncbi:tetratricopeptide repeat protein [Aureivirga sp. CE67]|uniref:tetratricopeptide repeat protein n=1 Tax=Aureivirga sp. CE67 TaxID=1788983 RepID=UPI0018CAA567|nr:tetratricopeptide repeat protein [Aureivirga sp. CE67]
MEFFKKIINKKTEEQKKFEEGLNLMDLEMYESAIKYFDEALELNPKFSLAHIYKAVCYLKEGKSNKAKESLLEAIKIDFRDSSPYFHLGNIERVEENYKAAIQSYKKSEEFLKSEEFKDVLFYNIGKSILDELEENDEDYEYERQDKMREEAKSYFIKALAENPKQFQANYEMGNIYFYYLNSRQKAKKYFEKTLRIISDLNIPNHYKLNSYRCLAICEAIEGNFELSLKYVEISLKLDSFSVYSYSGDIDLMEVMEKNPDFEKDLKSLLKKYEN